MRLNARQLREIKEAEIQEKLKTIKRNPIYFILENIYDTYNTGGLFRLADAIAVEKMYLCGEMEIPPNARIKKASIGTYKVVPWEYKRSAPDAIAELNSKLNDYEKTLHVTRYKLQVVAVEQNPKSVPYTKADYSFPLALIFGNETTGILPETLNLADQIVEIPMWGINRSLNVIVAASIVSYFIMEKV